MPVIDLDSHNQVASRGAGRRSPRFLLLWAAGLALLTLPGEAADLQPSIYGRPVCELFAPGRPGANSDNRQAVVVDVASGAVLQTMNCRP